MGRFDGLFSRKMRMRNAPARVGFDTKPGHFLRCFYVRGWGRSLGGIFCCSSSGESVPSILRFLSSDMVRFSSGFSFLSSAFSLINSLFSLASFQSSAFTSRSSALSSRRSLRSSVNSSSSRSQRAHVVVLAISLGCACSGSGVLAGRSSFRRIGP